MKNFLETANSRETSQEIMDAIYYVAGNDEDVADRMWDDPTEEELLAIWERVTRNGNSDSTLYTWGEAGYEWFKVNRNLWLSYAHAKGNNLDLSRYEWR